MERTSLALAPLPSITLKGAYMSSSLSRRSVIKGVATVSGAALLPASNVAAENTWKRGPGMPSEGPNTPKSALPSMDAT